MTVSLLPHTSSNSFSGSSVNAVCFDPELAVSQQTAVLNILIPINICYSQYPEDLRLSSGLAMWQLQRVATLDAAPRDRLRSSGLTTWPLIA